MADITEELQSDFDADAAFNDGAGLPAPSPTERPAEATAEPEGVAAPKYAQVTEEDLASFRQTAAETTALKAKVEQQLGTAFGKMGGFERLLKDMQAATPAGGAIKLPKTVVAKMEKDFPELAALMFDALEQSAQHMRGTGKATPTPAIDPLEIDKRVEARTLALQAEALEDRIPNWRKIVGEVDAGGKHDPNNPFRKWLKTQPEPYQVRLNSTNSADVIARAIDQFKVATKKPGATPAPSIRADRLREAVKPRGDGGRAGPTKAADDDFERGFAAG